MFDVGFWELLLVGVVALLVVGPERLPALARTVGLWVGRARRFVGSVKEDIDRELKTEELKQILAQQQKSNPLEEIIEETSASLGEIKQETESALSAAKDSADSQPATTPQSHDSK